MNVPTPILLAVLALLLLSVLRLLDLNTRFQVGTLSPTLNVVHIVDHL